MADCVSSGIERSSYATSSRALSPAPDFRFALPDDIKPEFFGDYPGVCYDTSNVLFSVNKGNGKWTPVLFNFRKGFSVLDDIEADALIPFSTYLETKHSDGKSQISGYIIVLKEINDGVQSRFYTISENLILSDEPFTIFPNRVLSVSSNHDKPGTLTIHFEVNRHENVTYELSLQNNDWSSINSVETFDEIVWIN